MTEYEYYASDVEGDLGRPIDQAEALELRALYLFGKALKLLRVCELEIENVRNRQIG
jgi:hypothetical protein